MRIVCSGYIVRCPIGGLTWHHLQYLVGFQQLGHEVTFVEDHGWENSCYDPERDVMTGDASYGIEYLLRCLRPHGLESSWCYRAQDGTVHGMSRERLAERCREADLYVNLSNVNRISESNDCAVRVLVDTDPVFTQLGAHGVNQALDEYDALFTYGENVHQPGCTMPTGGGRWIPTRQPVVLDLWRASAGRPDAAFTTIMSWSPYGSDHRASETYGQKDRSFEPYFSLPLATGVPMELAAAVPEAARQRLATGGWGLIDPIRVTRDPSSYQQYLASSRAEFSVAKHGYVATRCGWFSERSTGYLACGRPAVVQDTGFSDWLEAGAGVLPFNDEADAVRAIEEVNRRYAFHCRAAEELVAEYFDSRKVLSRMIERAISGAEADGRRSG